MNKLFKIIWHSECGAAMAIYTIIVTSAALIMASVAAEAGLFDIEMSYQDQKSTEALYITEGCAEEVLRRIRINENYGVGAGDINLSVLGGSCIIEVTDEGDGERLIVLEGTAYDEGNYSYSKVVYIVLMIDQFTKELRMTGWTEI